ncbi:MAG TPA: hypothetical protein P5084_12800 [Paludibacter sp.]|nr:hypothetical protein [Paludibacter sp.]
MKKIFLILTITMGIVFGANAQISSGTLQNAAKKATSVASASGFDVNSLSSGILSKLNTKLKLTPDQKTKVLSAVTSFLQDKSGIIASATTNKNQYVAKLAKLTQKLSTKLKPVLTASQYTKFLGLKPATNDANNVLSQLFY